MLSWFVNCRHKPVRDTFQQRDNDSSAVLTLAIHSVHSVQFPYCTVFLSIPFCINRFHIVLQKQGGRGWRKFLANTLPQPAQRLCFQILVPTSAHIPFFSHTSTNHQGVGVPRFGIAPPKVRWGA